MTLTTLATDPTSLTGASESVEPLDWHTSLLAGTGAYVLFGLLETTKSYILRRLEGSPRGFAFSMAEEMPWWLLWVVLLPLVLWLARTYRFDDGRWRRSVVLHAGAGLALSLAHVVADAAWIRLMSGAVGVQPPALRAEVEFFVLRFLFTDIVTYCATVGVYYAFEYFAGFRRSALAAASAEARAVRLQLNLAEARLHALRMELEPHFLFNALNSVAGLVRRREHDAAIEMLARLGDLLRTTLSRDMPPEITLREEVELVTRYLDIELVRFGDRLRVEWDVDPEMRSALVPPLILQPLVENALRHGIARRSGLACLGVSARRVGLHLELSVRDTGEGLGLAGGAAPREGIGLSNTRSRLAELYGAAATSLELGDEPGGGVRARVLLPYHSAEGTREIVASEA